MKTRAYPVPGIDPLQPATLVQADLARDHDVRSMPILGRPGVLLEIRRVQGLLQRGTGAGAVLKAWFQPTALVFSPQAGPQGFTVTVGTDKLEDTTMGAVEWLLTTPALLTEGYAAFKQSQVDERIFRTVEHWVATVARVRGPAPVPAVGPCPQCRTPLPFGARFCPRCAFDTQAPQAAACPGCRGPVALDATFCPHCGKKVGETAKGCRACAAPLEPEAMFCSACGASQKEEAR